MTGRKKNFYQHFFLSQYVEDVQPLDDFQVLDEASSQPGSPTAEWEEENLRPPLAVLEEHIPSEVSTFFFISVTHTPFEMPTTILRLIVGVPQWRFGG